MIKTRGSSLIYVSLCPMNVIFESEFVIFSQYFSGGSVPPELGQ